jgi:hypothetical protein
MNSTAGVTLAAAADVAGADDPAAGATAGPSSPVLTISRPPRRNLPAMTMQQLDLIQ